MTTNIYSAKSEQGFHGVLNFQGSNRITGYLSRGDVEHYELIGESRNGDEVLLTGDHCQFELAQQAQGSKQDHFSGTYRGKYKLNGDAPKDITLILSQD